MNSEHLGTLMKNCSMKRMDMMNIDEGL